MADLIEKSRTDVLRYRLGQRVPSIETAARIRKATKRKVTFEDFLPADTFPSVRKLAAD